MRKLHDLDVIFYHHQVARVGVDGLLWWPVKASPHCVCGAQPLSTLVHLEPHRVSAVWAGLYHAHCRQRCENSPASQKRPWPGGILNNPCGHVPARWQSKAGDGPRVHPEKHPLIVSHLQTGSRRIQDRHSDGQPAWHHTPQSVTGTRTTGTLTLPQIYRNKTHSSHSFDVTLYLLVLTFQPF